jgi:hypothetical protein
MMKTFGIVLLFALAGLSCDAPSDSPPEVRPVPTTTPPPSVAYEPLQAPIRPDLRQSIPSPTTTLPDTDCAEWYPLAMEVGWPEAEWPTLSYVMHRESRCDPSVTSRHDDRGLLQIHPPSWCQPNRYNEIGWLQAQGVINECEELYDPRQNLLAGYMIYLYGVEKHGYGWGPWSL